MNKYHNLKLFQPGGLISSPEESEQYRLNRAVNNSAQYYNRRPLDKFNNSDLGKTLDVVDLGLDIASITPTPAAPFAAGAGVITGLPQGLIGAYDYMLDLSREGLKWPTVDQNVAMLKLVPTGAIFGKLGKNGSKLLGKSDKWMRRAHPYFSTGNLTSQFQLVRDNVRRLPIFLGSAIPDGLNLTTDVYELTNSSAKDQPKSETKDLTKYKL